MAILGLTHTADGTPLQRLAVEVKVAIGLGPDEQEGRKAPKKLDHFVFLRKKGAELKWKLDEELNAFYCKRAGGDPQEIPIVLMADDPENIFRTAYEWWTATERRCWSNVLQENGKLVQVATRRTKEYPDGQPWSPPNPCGDGCPDLERGDCKPSADLYFILADFPTLGSVCRLHTSSYRSIRQIHSSLEQLRYTFGGRLMGLQVMLTCRPEKTAYLDSQGKKHTTTIYALSLELSANRMRELLEKATANAQLFEQTRKLLGGQRIEFVEEEEVKAPEINAEFHHVEDEADEEKLHPKRRSQGNGSAATVEPEDSDAGIRYAHGDKVVFLSGAGLSKMADVLRAYKAKEIKETGEWAIHKGWFAALKQACEKRKVPLVETRAVEKAEPPPPIEGETVEPAEPSGTLFAKPPTIEEPFFPEAELEVPATANGLVKRTGMVKSVHGPKTAKNNAKYYSLMMGGVGYFCYKRDLFDFIRDSEGYDCTFLVRVDSSDFPRIESVLKIGELEWTEEGLPVVRR